MHNLTYTHTTRNPHQSTYRVGWWVPEGTVVCWNSTVTMSKARRWVAWDMNKRPIFFKNASFDHHLKMPSERIQNGTRGIGMRRAILLLSQLRRLVERSKIGTIPTKRGRSRHARLVERSTRLSQSRNLTLALLLRPAWWSCGTRPVAAHAAQLRRTVQVPGASSGHLHASPQSTGPHGAKSWRNHPPAESPTSSPKRSRGPAPRQHCTGRRRTRRHLHSSHRLCVRRTRQPRHRWAPVRKSRQVCGQQLPETRRTAR